MARSWHARCLTEGAAGQGAPPQRTRAWRTTLRRERFAFKITAKGIPRGSYASVDDLEAAIYNYLLQHSARPKPFTWTKSAQDILT
jgi:hypothetical protein